MVIYQYDSATGSLKAIPSPPVNYQGEGGRIGISADGRYIAYPATWTGGKRRAPADCCGGGLFSYDRVSGQTINAGPIISNSSNASISATGRYIAFSRRSTNQADIQDTDVVVWDRITSTTRLVSVHLGGAPADGSSDFPAIDSNGTRIAFSSDASNLVGGDTNGRSDVFVRATS
jgi:Tol biopolymer transport system component